MAKSKTKTVQKTLAESPTHLLHRALQLALDFHVEAAGPAGLTQRQFAVLSAAAASEGLTQSDLVRATGIDRSTLADLVARMTAKGLIAKERSAQDARANTVRATLAGFDALKAGRAPAQTADQRLMALLPAKRQSGFLKALGELAEAADASRDGKSEKAAKPKAEKKKKKKKAAKKAAKAAIA